MDFKDETPMTDEERAQAERGAALIAAAVARVEAPQSLREAIERERSRARSAPRRGRLGRLVLGPAGAAMLVAIVVGGVLGLSALDDPTEGGGATVAQVASVGGRLPATSGAPASDGSRLNVSVEGVVFPDWTDIKWKPTGRRTDTVGGRRVETVYYADKDGVTIAYSIVAGKKLKWPDGTDVEREGERYRVSVEGGRPTVTWIQSGHTCVVSGPSDIDDSKLLKLAASEPA